MKKLELTVTKQNNIDVLKYDLSPADVYDDRAGDKVSQMANIIPFQYSDEDGKRSITSYAKDGTPLELMFKKTLSKKEVLCIVSGLAAAFEIGAQGVPVSYIVKDTNHIYVNEETLAVKCVIVPIKQDVMPMAELPILFREVLSRMRFDDKDKDNYVATLLTLINSDDFSAYKLKELSNSELEKMGLFISKDNGLVNMTDNSAPQNTPEIKVNKLGVMNNMMGQRAPMGGQAPMPGQPPMMGQPQMGGQRPAMPGQPQMGGQRPAMPGQPPMMGQPQMGGQPPMMGQPQMGGQRPSMPGQPPMMGQPQMGGQRPSMPGQPPMMGQPQMGGQPPMMGQPQMGGQRPSMPGQPPMMGQPQMGGQRPAMPGQPPMMGQPQMAGQRPPMPSQPPMSGMPGMPNSQTAQTNALPVSNQTNMPKPSDAAMVTPGAPKMPTAPIPAFMPAAPVEEPKAEEPVAAPVEEPKAEEPVAAPVEEPKAEEPAAPVEEPKAEEPVVAPVEEPKAEEPVAPVEEPKAEEPVAAPVEEQKAATPVAPPIPPMPGVMMGGLVGQLGAKPVPHIIRKKTGEAINITKSEFAIGKSQSKADYTIENNSAISRVHCIIVQRDGVNYIKDNNSTNHTYVNGVELEPGKEVLLKNKTVIQLGDEEFTFLLRRGE